MFGYNPQYQNNSGQIQGQGMISGAQLQAQEQMQLAQIRAEQQQQQRAQQQAQQQQLMNGLEQIGGAVGGYMDKKNQADAMDKGVGMMSDLGIIKPDTRDSFMNLDRSHKPLVWDLLNKSMFAPYAAGRSASEQAKGWADNRNGSAPGYGNKYGYSYPGP